MLRVLRPFLALGLVVAVTGAAWATCVSGALTPEQRACCVAMNHDCGVAGIEMGCCTSEPHTSDFALTSAAGQAPVAPALVTGPLALLPAPHVPPHTGATQPFAREMLHLPDRPAYLLFSEFRI